MNAAAPCLLVLDTATERLHLGLGCGAGRWLRELPGGPQASAQLLPALRGLLDEAGMAWSAVDAIGFGRGPGAFTGVRAACAVAQGLALGLDRPVLALDTLMAVAEDARQRGLPASPVWAVVDARMGEVYAARYGWTPEAEPGDAGDASRAGHWQALDAPALRDPAALAARVRAEGDAVVGNGLTAYAEAFDGCAGDADAAPRAAALLALAHRQWRQGQQRDAAQALPLYVRDKVAQTTEERRHAAALKAADAGPVAAGASSRGDAGAPAAPASGGIEGRSGGRP